MGIQQGNFTERLFKTIYKFCSIHTNLLPSIGFCHQAIDVGGGGQMLPSTGTGGKDRRCRRRKSKAIKNTFTARESRGVGAMENVAATRGLETFNSRGGQVLNGCG